jgi:hypothetical protein
LTGTVEERALRGLDRADSIDRIMLAAWLAEGGTAAT